MEQNQSDSLKPRAAAHEGRLHAHHHSSSSELWDVSSTDEDSDDDEYDSSVLFYKSPPYPGGCLESLIVKSVYWILRVKDSLTLFEDSKQD